MNERSKKIYAVVIAILLVLSFATSFLPSIQVNAEDEPISFEVTSLDFISSGRFTGIDSGFNYSLYETGYNNAITGNRFPLDALENVVSADRNPFPRDYDSVYTSLVSNFENYNYSVTFNDFGSGTTYNDLKSFITDPSSFNYYVCIGNASTSSNPGISIYYSYGDLKLCQVNKTVYAYSTDTIYNMNFPFNQNYTADYRDIYTYSANTLSNVSNTFYNVYSTFPIFLTYHDNGISGDNDYSSYSSASTLATDYLVNGVNSEFFIDRRLLFSNFVPDGYNVNSDPISQENVGVYDFDFYPSGDVTSGVLNIDNLQLSAKTSEMENVHLYALITYNFQCNGFYYEYGTNVGLVENYILQNMNTKISRFNIRNVNILETTIDLDDTSYQTFSSRSIMKDTGPSDGEKYSIYIEDGIPRSIDMFDLYGISNYCQFIASTQTTPKTKVGNISSSVVTAFQVSCSIKVDYNDGQVSKTLATNTYDYFTGENYKYGFTSTDNNTPADEMPSTVTDGLQWINNGGFGNGVGGNTVNGGSNSNSNTNSNNPSFTNNNNPTINIENNNTGGGFGTPETQNGMIEEIWSIWSSWQFLKDITQEVAENDFIQFVFSGDLYQLPLMNIVIPAVAVIVFISIASTVIRFIRGN